MQPKRLSMLLLATALGAVVLSEVRRPDDPIRRWTAGGNVRAEPARGGLPQHVRAPFAMLLPPRPESRIVPVSSLDNASYRAGPLERDELAEVIQTLRFEADVMALARHQAADPTLREYAAAQYAGRQAWCDQLDALGELLGLQLPTVTDPERQAQVTELAHVAGRAFDHRFVELAGGTEQRTTLWLVEHARSTAHNPTLVAWYDRALPVLRASLARARALKLEGLPVENRPLVAWLKE